LEEEQGKSSGFPGQVVGSMQFTVETDDEEEESKDKRRERRRSLDEDTEDEEVLTERELIEGVTERTVAALRKLAKDGLITREQKRRLLTDVIRHHQQGEEASEVEIAYELLVMRFLPPPPLSLLGESSAAASGALEDVAEEDLLEDFADQCLILSKRLD